VSNAIVVPSFVAVPAHDHETQVGLTEPIRLQTRQGLQEDLEALDGRGATDEEENPLGVESQSRARRDRAARAEEIDIDPAGDGAHTVDVRAAVPRELGALERRRRHDAIG